MKLHQANGSRSGREIWNAHAQTVRTPTRPIRPNGPWNEEPVVWYESPFADAEWLPQSTAEQLFRVERAKWERLGSEGKPPRIVERAVHVAEVAETLRAVVQHVPAPRSAHDQLLGVTRCARCDRVIVKDRKEFHQAALCKPLAMVSS